MGSIGEYCVTLDIINNKKESINVITLNSDIYYDDEDEDEDEFNDDEGSIRVLITKELIDKLKEGDYLDLSCKVFVQ